MGCSGSKGGAGAGGGSSESKGPAEDKVVVALKSKRRGIFTSTRIDGNHTYVKKTFPKSPQARQIIARALKNHFLFANLRPDEANEVIDAMRQRVVNAGTVVIKQGACHVARWNRSWCGTLPSLRANVICGLAHPLTHPR